MASVNYVRTWDDRVFYTGDTVSFWGGKHEGEITAFRTLPSISLVHELWNDSVDPKLTWATVRTANGWVGDIALDDDIQIVKKSTPDWCYEQRG